MIARELSYYDLKIAVLEKSYYVCSGQSKGNGALVHAGHNEKPGTLKSRLCVEGNRIFPEICRDLGVYFKRTGYTILAFNQEESAILKALEKQSMTNGVRVEIISPARLAEVEPNASGEAIAALRVLDTGITDIHRLVIAAAEHAAVNGVDFLFETEVQDLIKERTDPGRITGVSTSKGEYSAKLVINCAGVNADELIRKVTDSGFEIKARKGEYYIIDKAEGDILNGAVYPVPTPQGKGCAVFPTAHGNTIVGGNSILSVDREDTSTSREDFEDVLKQGIKLVPALKGKKMIAGFTGLRSSVYGKDFIIGPQDGVDGLFNVVGIDSPGLSSAPAIASHVKDMIGESYFDLKRDPEKLMNYRIKPLFRDLGMKGRRLWLKKDPGFGRIVCRCENVTEGDVISAMHAPIPAKSVDAIKFKTWAGAGRCQGAFDISRIITILSSELGTLPPEVLKRGRGSNIVTGHTRKF